MTTDNKIFERKCPTDGCGENITYTRKDSYKSTTNKNTLCMKCNRKKRGGVNIKYLNEGIISKVLSIYYDKTKTLKTIAIECGIKYDTLNKIIKLKNLPIIKRDHKYIDRNKSMVKMFKTKYGIEYDEYLKTKSEFYKYKSRVKYYTKKTIKQCSTQIENLDKVGKGLNDYHIDHIVSIKDCFMVNLDVKIVADIINLRAIPSFENLSKGSSSLFSPQMLLINVTERINNKIKISELYGFFHK
jgi:hypothetical protein